MRALFLLASALALCSCADLDDVLHPSRAAQPVVQGQTCRFRDATPNGAGKICNYDCSGSLVATSVKAGEQCPATATYP